MVMGAAVASSRSKKQAAQASAQPQAAATGATDIEQLKQLAELKDQGILTQAEFDAKKKQILGL
jgi:membrane protease subunit (stomatin/prohibitin family)